MGKETIRGGDPAAPSWEDQHPVDYRFAANAAVRAIEAQRTRPRGPTPWYLLPVPGCYDCGRSPEGVCLEHLLSRRSAVDAEALADARELDALRVEVCLLREEANVIPNDDWRATPAAIQDSWRRWARAQQARGGVTDSSTSFAAGWHARWTDAQTRAELRELRRLRAENDRLRAQLDGQEPTAASPDDVPDRDYHG